MTTPRPRGRSLFGRLAVMGVATLASAVAVAPVAAVADDIAPETPTGETGTPTADQATPDQAGPDEPAPEVDVPEALVDGTDAVATPAEITMPLGLTVPSTERVAADEAPAAAQAAAADPMAPVFGTGKQRQYRVTAQLADGAFAPDGTTTAGSTFDIVTTLDDGSTSTASCTSVPATVAPLRAYSTCPGPGVNANFPLNTFSAPPNATMVTITQTSAPADQPVLADPEPFVLLPCDTGAAGCETVRNTSFMDPGSILPVTVDDAVTTTAAADPFRIDVLANDNPDDDPTDPNTTLTVTQPPEGQGTVRVVDNARGMALRYTPPTTFTGVVPITYTVTNGNGSTNGTLNVTVQDREFAESPANRGFRVTASIDPDADVPDDSSSAGSTFSIVYTYNDQPDSDPITCTSVGSNLAGTVGYSGCARNGNPPVFGIFPAPVGATSVVITQLTAPDGLVADPEPYVLLPCIAGEDGCDQNRNTDFLLTAELAPVTVDDTATAVAGGDPIDVDVLDNDSSDSPVTGLTVTQPPAGQGSVEVIGAPADPAARATGAGTLQLRYTPSADFTGEVPITYTVSNAGGSTDGTLTVTVEAAAVVVPPTDPPVDNGDGNGDDTNNGDDTDDVAAPVPGDTNNVDAVSGALPDAGGPGAELLGIGAMLVVAGSALTLRARRRSSGVRAH